MHHADPFDRMIIATALVEDVPLIGGDGQFARYEGLRAIW
jgi:PIN domain nuclease of toxin-antitoxin system